MCSLLFRPTTLIKPSDTYIISNSLFKGKEEKAHISFMPIHIIFDCTVGVSNAPHHHSMHHQYVSVFSNDWVYANRYLEGIILFIVMMFSLISCDDVILGRWEFWVGRWGGVRGANHGDGGVMKYIRSLGLHNGWMSLVIMLKPRALSYIKWMWWVASKPELAYLIVRMVDYTCTLIMFDRIYLDVFIFNIFFQSDFHTPTHRTLRNYSQQKSNPSGVL